MKFNAEGDIQHQLALLLNNGLELHDNMRGALVEVETTGGVEEIQHNLGWEPIGWIVLYKDGSVELYAENISSWNSQRLYLRSSAPNVTVRLFVL